MESQQHSQLSSMSSVSDSMDHDFTVGQQNLFLRMENCELRKKNAITNEIITENVIKIKKLKNGKKEVMKKYEEALMEIKRQNEELQEHTKNSIALAEKESFKNENEVLKVTYRTLETKFQTWVNETEVKFKEMEEEKRKLQVQLQKQNEQLEGAAKTCGMYQAKYNDDQKRTLEAEKQMEEHRTKIGGMMEQTEQLQKMSEQYLNELAIERASKESLTEELETLKKQLQYFQQRDHGSLARTVPSNTSTRVENQDASRNLRQQLPPAQSNTVLTSQNRPTCPLCGTMFRNFSDLQAHCNDCIQ